MHKLTVLASLALVAMVACDPSVTGPNPNVSGDDSANDSSDDSSATPVDTSSPSTAPTVAAPTTSATTSTPTPAGVPALPGSVLPTPQTCSSIVSVTTPAGAFHVTAGKTSARDVYAVETYYPAAGDAPSQATLTVTFTNVFHTCDYRANHLLPMNIAERSYSVSHPVGSGDATSFAPGVYAGSVGAMDESGPQCQKPPVPGAPPVGFTGTAESGFNGTGDITIVSRTGNVISGVVNVVGPNGEQDVISFTAPLCLSTPNEAQQGNATCCEN